MLESTQTYALHALCSKTAINVNNSYSNAQMDSPGNDKRRQELRCRLQPPVHIFAQRCQYQRPVIISLLHPQANLQ